MSNVQQFELSDPSLLLNPEQTQQRKILLTKYWRVGQWLMVPLCHHVALYVFAPLHWMSRPLLSASCCCQLTPSAVFPLVFIVNSFLLGTELFLFLCFSSASVKHHLMYLSILRNDSCCSFVSCCYRETFQQHWTNYKTILLCRWHWFTCTIEILHFYRLDMDIL